VVAVALLVSGLGAAAMSQMADTAGVVSAYFKGLFS
jgi:hypothetical protein